MISKEKVHAPSLDLGCGNGVFSFITAGGAFSPEYDGYRNVRPEGFWENRDIYDCYSGPLRPPWIAQMPNFSFTWGLDHKRNLLRQAMELGFYGGGVMADANRRLPFSDGAFQTVFSNILYWLESPEVSLREIGRLLAPKGRALLCLQNPQFKEYCFTARWRDTGSPLLRMLNRGREECHRWTLSESELGKLAGRVGFRVVSCIPYLSPLTLRVWDIGLRPLSPVLIKMVDRLSESDRLSAKTEWIETLAPFLKELYEMDDHSRQQGGYSFVVLKKEEGAA